MRNQTEQEKAKNPMMDLMMVFNMFEPMEERVGLLFRPGSCR